MEALWALEADGSDIEEDSALVPWADEIEVEVLHSLQECCILLPPYVLTELYHHVIVLNKHGLHQIACQAGSDDDVITRQIGGTLVEQLSVEACAPHAEVLSDIEKAAQFLQRNYGKHTLASLEKEAERQGVQTQTLKRRVEAAAEASHQAQTQLLRDILQYVATAVEHGTVEASVFVYLVAH
eukprot:354200-Amphidinium_carterae.3